MIKPTKESNIQRIRKHSPHPIEIFTDWMIGAIQNREKRPIDKPRLFIIGVIAHLGQFITLQILQKILVKPHSITEKDIL